MHILLPNASDALVDDRFSLLDSDEERVPLFAILKHLLTQEIREMQQLVELLDTLHCTLDHKYGGDYGHLAHFLRHEEVGRTFFTEVWPTIVRCALDIPNLFPEGRLPILNRRKVNLQSLNRQQGACLVAHQFLCSIPRPTWYPKDRSHDFHIWYKEDQPHANIVSAYLMSVLTYFLQKPFAHFPENDVKFLLTSASSEMVTRAYQSDLPLQKPRYTETTEAVFPTAKKIEVKGPYNIAEVVSANKDVGFGRSATQEEILVGTSPEACPAVLFTCSLETDEVLIVEGALAMTSIIGYNRSARLNGMETFPDQGGEGWNRRTLLFMDALELDGYESNDNVPDLLPGHIAREYQKAFAAFSSHLLLARPEPYGCIVTPLWGCGAFCGDPQIKLLIMLCASSVAASAQFHIFTAKDRTSVSSELNELLKFLDHYNVPVGFVLNTLESIEPSDIIHGRNSFDFVMRKFLAQKLSA